MATREPRLATLPSDGNARLAGQVGGTRDLWREVQKFARGKYRAVGNDPFAALRIHAPIAAHDHESLCGMRGTQVKLDDLESQASARACCAGGLQGDGN